MPSFIHISKLSDQKGIVLTAACYLDISHMYRSHRGGVTQERGNSNALMTGDQFKVTSPLLKEKATQLLVYVRDKNKSQRQTNNCHKNAIRRA